MHPKSFVGWAVPGPTGGAYSAPPDPLAGFKGPTSKEGEGKGGKWRGRVGRGRKSGEERGRVGREGEGIGGKERGSAQPCPLHIISGYATERSVK